jgi:hypothetical protein
LESLPPFEEAGYPEGIPLRPWIFEFGLFFSVKAVRLTENKPNSNILEKNRKIY